MNALAAPYVNRYKVSKREYAYIVLNALTFILLLAAYFMVGGVNGPDITDGFWGFIFILSIGNLMYAFIWRIRNDQ